MHYNELTVKSSEPPERIFKAGWIPFATEVTRLEVILPQRSEIFNQNFQSFTKRISKVMSIGLDRKERVWKGVSRMDQEPWLQAERIAARGDLWLRRRPVCADCGRPIVQERCLPLEDGGVLCPDCVKDRMVEVE